MKNIYISCTAIFMALITNGCTTNKNEFPNNLDFSTKKYSGNIRSNTMYPNQYTLFTDNERLVIYINPNISDGLWEKCTVVSNGFNFRPESCKFSGLGSIKKIGKNYIMDIEEYKIKF